MNSRELAFSLIFDSSDEDDVPRKIRERIPHFEEMDHVEFRRRFRLSKQTVGYLALKNGRVFIDELRQYRLFV